MESTRVQLPQGVRDLGPAEAAARREVTGTLAQTFASWGYQEVVPPTFEFYGTLAHGFAGREAERLFRFFDREGRILALRPDFTAQIARLAATTLAEKPRPLRLWYCGSLFRAEASQSGYQSEFTQAGVELMGAAGPMADAEVVALALTALDKAGISSARLSLGHTGFLRALLEGCSLSLTEQSAVVTELTRRNLVGLKDVLGSLNVSEEQRQSLLLLPQLFGGTEILAVAAGLATGNEKAQEALADLKAIAGLLAQYGLAERVQFDLGLVRELDYYTGMVFEAYVAGFGYPLCGGGRYDNLTENFGLPGPATGFALGLERVLTVRERQGSDARPEETAALIVAETGFEQEAVREAVRRRETEKVELDVSGMSLPAAAEYAQARGLKRIIVIGQQSREVKIA